MISTRELAQLDQLPLGRLKTLRTELVGLIARKEEENRRVALREISRLAGEAGLTAETVTHHLNGRKRGRQRAKLPPRYRDPQQPENTWAGRGKRPKWLVAKLAAGARIEDFAITSATEVQNADRT